MWPWVGVGVIVFTQQRLFTVMRFLGQLHNTVQHTPDRSTNSRAVHRSVTLSELVGKSEVRRKPNLRSLAGDYFSFSHVELTRPTGQLSEWSRPLEAPRSRAMPSPDVPRASALCWLLLPRERLTCVAAS